ncbi:MAG TPA: DUF1295 domain-containing protein [Anaerolineales bacterium]|nr:DUF1295 domain-containing protein [Anaerolineales bacterium]
MKTSLIGIGLALAITLLIGWGASVGGVTIGGQIPAALMVFFVAFLIQWIAFIPAFLLKTEKFYDLTGGITFITVIWLAWIMIPSAPLINTIFALMISIWALRLSTFLFSRIHKAGADTRFEEIKKSFFRFLLTWTLQGTWAALSAGPAIAVLTSNKSPNFPLLSWIGIGIWILGIGFEVIADLQKSEFRKNPNNKGKFIQTGLWAKSRHPNYFGEWFLWFGLTISAIPFLQGFQFVTLISPIFVYFLLTKISGVPLLEKQADERWGDQPDYQEYKKRVPEFFPRFF